MVVMRGKEQAIQTSTGLQQSNGRYMHGAVSRTHISAVGAARRALAAAERHIDNGDIDRAEKKLDVAGRHRMRAAEPIPHTRDARLSPWGRNVIALFEETTKLRDRINELKLAQRPQEAAQEGS